VSKLDSNSSNIILVGRWNPAIITPDWLRAQFPDFITQTEYDAEFIPTAIPKIRFIVEGLRVAPSSARLTISPDTDSEGVFDRIATLAAGIYTKLPHTPIPAVGHNFFFRLEEGDELAFAEIAPAEMVRAYDRIGLPALAETEVRHQFPFEKYKLTIGYRSTARLLMFNYHYDVHTFAETESAIKQLPENFARTLDLSAQLVKQGTPA